MRTLPRSTGLWTAHLFFGSHLLHLATGPSSGHPTFTSGPFICNHNSRLSFQNAMLRPFLGPQPGIGGQTRTPCVFTVHMSPPLRSLGQFGLYVYKTQLLIFPKTSSSCQCPISTSSSTSFLLNPWDGPLSATYIHSSHPPRKPINSILKI